MRHVLKERHKSAIIAVIAASSRVDRAVLYGSRATSTNTVWSDVDLALFGDSLTLSDLAGLSASIEVIPMAQRVDLLLFRTVQNQSLRDHIQNEGVEWYARSQPVDSGE